MEAEGQSKGADSEKNSASASVRRKKSGGIKRTDLPPPPPPPAESCTAAAAETGTQTPRSESPAGDRSAENSGEKIHKASADRLDSAPTKSAVVSPGKTAVEIQSRPLPPPPIPSTKPVGVIRKKSVEQPAGVSLLADKTKPIPPVPPSKPRSRTNSPRGSPDIHRKISANNKASPQSSPQLSRVKNQDSFETEDNSNAASVDSKPSPPKLPTKLPPNNKHSPRSSPQLSRVKNQDSLETEDSGNAAPVEPKRSPPKLPTKPPRGKQNQPVEALGSSVENNDKLTQTCSAKPKPSPRTKLLGNSKSSSLDSEGDQTAVTSDTSQPSGSNKSDSTTGSEQRDITDTCVANSTDHVESSPQPCNAVSHSKFYSADDDANTDADADTSSQSKFYVADDGDNNSIQQLEDGENRDCVRRVSASKFYVDTDKEEENMALNQSTRTVKTYTTSSAGGGGTRQVTTVTQKTTVISGKKVQKSASSVTSTSWKGQGDPLDEPIRKLMRDSAALKLLQQKTGAFGDDSGHPIPPVRRHKPSTKFAKALSEEDQSKSSPNSPVQGLSKAFAKSTNVVASKTTTVVNENSGSPPPFKDWKAGLKPVRPAPFRPPRPEAGKVEMRPVRVQVQKQNTINSFTTEDLDLFQGRKSRDIAEDRPTVKPPPPPTATKPTVQPRKSRRDGAGRLGAPEDSPEKRRSRSVGAPFQAMRLRMPERPEVPSKPKLPGPGEVTPGPSPAGISALTTRLQKDKEDSTAVKTVNIPIVITKSEEDEKKKKKEEKKVSRDEDINANKGEDTKPQRILRTPTDTQVDRSGKRNAMEPRRDDVEVNANVDKSDNKKTGTTDSNKNILLDPSEIDDPNLDHNVPSDSEDSSMKKAQSLDDIYQEIEFSDGEKSPAVPKTPTRKEQRKDSSPETSPGDKEEEEKLRLKRKFTKKLPRKMSRKYSKRPVRTKVENIYSSIDDLDDDVLEFSDQDSDSNFEEDSLTDDSDLDFEEQMVAKLASKGQLSVTEEQVEDLVEEIYAERSMSKLQKVALELLTTERAYVEKLDLVDQTFHLTIVMTNRSHHMFPDDVIPQMFSNIKSIYQFHHDFLLPKLEERMQQWSEVQKIGDVMKNFAPFLKLYTEYVKNFDNAMNTISLWMDKSPKFASILTELQKLPRCGKLSLQHHMLEPIQRVPRYELLLKDYLKHLPADSLDQDDTEKALQLVTTAASHSNEAMRKIEKFRKLLDINERLLGGVDLISPTRELVKEGKIVKISARNGDHLERYLFLFNDLFLLCQTIPIGIVHQYRIKAALEIGGMQVLEGDNLETPNTFYVKSKKKAIELHTSTMDEKVAWQVTLWNIIADYTKKQMSRQAGLTVAEAFLEEELGKRAPTWIKDQETSMCMLCGATFSAFKRRHHCRACGIVVCGKCSTHKAQLAYDDCKPNRVCDKCFNTLMQQEGRAYYQTEVVTPEKKTKGVLVVKATDSSLLNGYLHMTCDKKIWQKRYFAVHDNFVLYSFKAHHDVTAMTSMPLPGYIVGEAEKIDALDRENVFKLFHQGQSKIYYFQAEDKGHMKRWLAVLQKVVLAELPSSPHSSIISQLSTTSLNS